MEEGLFQLCMQKLFTNFFILMVFDLENGKKHRFTKSHFFQNQCLGTVSGPYLHRHSIFQPQKRGYIWFLAVFSPVTDFMILQNSCAQGRNFAEVLGGEHPPPKS